MNILLIIKKLIFSENNLALVGLIFLTSSIIFGLYIYNYEHFSTLNTFYYLITTATTVGYGDLSPQTDTGKILAIIYMIISIGSLGILIGVVGEKLLNIGQNIKKGKIMINSKVNLLIVGYPSEEKIKNLISQLRKNKKFKNKTIVLISDKLTEKPSWFVDFDVSFISGVGSDIETLESANINDTELALVLAEDSEDIRSDDFSSSTISVIENLNPSIKTIVEKVRKSDILFITANADIITDVTSANILSQEILNEGAIEFEKAIFDNDIEGTQYNEEYTGNDTEWKDLALKYIMEGKVPEGYRNTDMELFNFLPFPTDIVKKGAIFKYRGKHR